MSVLADPAVLARGVIGVGFSGNTCDAAPLDALRAFGPGALILFARNAGTPDELHALVSALRAISTPPPLIAIDQEGGRVERIGAGVSPLPPAMAVGATGDVALAGRLGVLLGRDLARLGISVDLAPVADLALQPPNAAVGTRAYGDDPERAGAFAGAFAAGLECGGVAATLKHFPGHGSTADDSHIRLPRVTAGAATLRARDLVPFARALRAGAASLVMTAHVVVEAFDAEQPASLSPAVIGELLRGELGFDGIVVTDCLEMDAITQGVGTVRGAVEALSAGADLLLISHHLELAHAWDVLVPHWIADFLDLLERRRCDPHLESVERGPQRLDVYHIVAELLGQLLQGVDASVAQNLLPLTHGEPPLRRQPATAS